MLKLYGEVLTLEKRNELSNKTGISKDDIMQLTKLTDLSRIRWVNHTFAYIYYWNPVMILLKRLQMLITKRCMR